MIVRTSANYLLKARGDEPCYDCIKDGGCDSCGQIRSERVEVGVMTSYSTCDIASFTSPIRDLNSCVN